MKKTITLLVLTIIILTYSFNVFSEVSHTAEEVKPGTFGGNFASGNFSFPDSISVTNSVSSSKVCIGGDCRSVWPSDSSDSGWQDTGSSVVLISNTDKVGIGTSSPSYKLDVNGSFRVNNGHLRIKTSVVNPLRINTSYPYNYIELGGGAQNLGLTVNTGDSSSFFVWNNASGQWRFFTRGGSASNIKMVIEDTGNVGIGTISPSVPLEVYTSSSPGFMLRGDPDIVLNSTPGVSSIAQIKFYNSSVRYGELGYNFASKKVI